MAELLDGMWANQPAFLVGGGPSLALFDWSLLSNRPNVICVNTSFLKVPTAFALMTEDFRWIERFAPRPEYKAFAGLRIFHCLDEQHQPLARALDPDITIITKKNSAKVWSKRLEDGLSFASNSMVSALNLVDIFGADPIYLLGVDCKPVRYGNPNFHEEYPQDWRSGDGQLENFKGEFENWCAPNLRHRRVVNLSIDSAVTCWTRMRPDMVMW